jgi:hypothetical protein
MAASDQIVFSLRKDRVKEKSQLVIGATFRDRATAANVTPTNISYRLDCLTTGTQILDWTIVSTDDEITITVTAEQNKIQGDCNRLERKQLTVASDYALTTQFVESIEWDVENLRGIT